jgi:hypothetical protein
MTRLTGDTSGWTRIALVLGPVIFGLVYGSCDGLDTVVNPDEVLRLAAEDATLPADGFSTTIITAQISPQADERFRDIIFTTTLGKFLAANPEDPATIEVTVESSGRAVATLQASPQVGTASVTAEIREGRLVKVARTVEVRFEPVPASDILDIRAASDSAPADGETVTDIVAKVARAVPLAQRDILFRTTMGSFGSPVPQQTTRTAGADSVARVGLISALEPGVAVVTATINGREARTSVEFEPALPDGIAVSVFGSLQLRATFATKVTVEAELFRRVGTVTPGTGVRFRAFDDSTGHLFGFWSGITPSDENGIITAQFTPGNTTERGEATIRVRVPDTDISGRVKIEIIDPLEPTPLPAPEKRGTN